MEDFVAAGFDEGLALFRETDYSTFDGERAYGVHESVVTVYLRDQNNVLVIDIQGECCSLGFDVPGDPLDNRPALLQLAPTIYELSTEIVASLEPVPI